MYEIINITIHGAGHIKRGEPCEDFSISIEDDFYKIFVVADGHGDSNCPRSSYGSQYICKIASEGLIEFARSIRSEKWENILVDPRYQVDLIRHLSASIIGNWKEAVTEEYEKNPLTPEERAGCTRYIKRYDKGERIDHIYGTTMIAGLMTDDYLLLLQQGDGRCDVYDGSGNVSQPIPWDDRCFSNVTTSLCDTDAIDSCRYYVIDLKKNTISAVLAGTDGVEDSFPDMELMHSYYRDLLIYAAENSVEDLKIHLEETLPDFSETGSRDDVSIGGFIDVEQIKMLISKFLRENYLVEVKSKLKLVEDRISSMENGKMEHLEEKCQKAEKEYKTSPNENTENKYSTAKKELEEYKARYDRFIAQKVEIEARIKMLSEAPAEDETDEIPVEIEVNEMSAENESIETPAENDATDQEEIHDIIISGENTNDVVEVAAEDEELSDRSKWTDDSSGYSTED